MKLNAIGTSGELIQLGAEGATPWLKNVKAESLRQRDRGAKTIFRRAPFVPALNQMFLPELLIFVSATSFLFF